MTSGPPTPTDPRRRALLAGSASAALAAGFAAMGSKVLAQTPSAPAAPAAEPKPLPAYVSWKDPSAMIVHSTATVETRRSAFGSSVITPTGSMCATTCPRRRPRSRPTATAGN